MNSSSQQYGLGGPNGPGGPGGPGGPPPGGPNILLEQSPAATEEASSLANRQFWQRGDKIELRCRSMFLAAEKS